VYNSDMSTTDPQAFQAGQPFFLSPVETAFWHAEKWVHGAFRTGGLFRLDGYIDRDLMVSALQQLQRKHPKLRAVIVQENNGRLRYDFGPAVQPIPFEIRDYDAGEAPFREEARRMLESEFQVGAPLLLVTALRNRSLNCSYLILVVHHAISDGVAT